MPFKVRTQIPAGELTDTDTLIDKSGKAWHVAHVVHGPGNASVSFELKDPASGLVKHKMTRPHDHPVTVLRHDTSEPVTPDRGIENVKAILSAEVVTEVTTEQQAEADRATETEPAVIPQFDSLTDLEQRSHLYLLHGIWADDLKPRATVAGLHAELHAGTAKVESKYVPHRHESEADRA